MSYNANGLLNSDGSVTQFGNTRSSGGGGGVGTVINLTTSYSALFNQTVTLTGTYDTYTATFDSTGHTTVNVFYVDTYSITCQGLTDSVTVTAIGLVINADAFSITVVNITTSDSDLIGKTISVYFGSDPTDVRASLTFDNNLSVSFQTEDIGTYNIVIGYSNPVSFSVSTVGGSVSVTYNPTPTGSSVIPVNNVRNWLDSAKVFDKNYTTISQVLSDTTTLQTLISSQNANDYLVRSTSWVSDVCGNSTAMSYIGLNNYSANTLLANSTWCTGICNSTYFESVLNVKVPTMTSNTTPSGVASASSYQSDGLPYNAFDNSSYDGGTTAQGWIPNSNDNPCWLQYQFASSIKLKKYKYSVLNNRNERMFEGKLQGSNNGTNWDDLSTFSTKSAGSGGSAQVNAPAINVIGNNVKYIYYRFVATSPWFYRWDDYVGMCLVQLYGRQDV